MIAMARYSTILVLLLGSLGSSVQELWEKDMTDEVYIEASTEGFESVHLTCEDSSMTVRVELDEDFSGIFYTRGSYKMGQLPCFNDIESGTQANLTVPFDDCRTQSDGPRQTNVVIVQHDDFLIFPGDFAFEISCEGSQASIGLADPDPSAKELPKHRKSTVSGDGSVTFTPQDVRPKRAPSKKKQTEQKSKKKSKQDKQEL